MAFIIKDTTALINTQLTDVGRRKISQGNFNVAYFQLGDSEVCYDCISGGNLTTLQVLVPEFNYQNNTGVPQSNKMGIKYPIYLSSSTGETNTFGIPFQDSQVVPIFNTAQPRGFFTGSTGAFSAFTSSALTVTANYKFNLSALTSGNTFDVTVNNCDATVTGTPEVGQFVVLYLNNDNNCGNDLTYPYPILTYRVEDVVGSTITVDRILPDFSSFTGTGRAFFYPSGMTPYYDSYTPTPYYDGGVFSFELNCEIQQQDVLVWNMNQPWTESPAGLSYTFYKDFSEFGSTGYSSTKEFLGYQTKGGQIFEDINYVSGTTDTFYYNSFDEKIYVEPEEQKVIGLIHYTNQGIDNFYGEKFATEAFDLANSGATGQGRNFKLDLPTLMWHKSNTGVMGESFYVDPDGFDGLNLFQPHYMLSEENDNMNYPGLRYYHLWDTHANADGYPNRVGKVFPDLKMIAIDDEELSAAMSYKSNRNYTLPAPRLGLVVPNTFNQNIAATSGILTGDTETMFVTYRFENTGSTEDMGLQPSGFTCTNVKLICQIVPTGERPDSMQWREIDVTSAITANTGSINIGPLEISGTTFQITKDEYDNASFYRLENYIELPLINYNTGMTFGDEYFFYGTVHSDVQATIYEMRYLVNLADSYLSKYSLSLYSEV